MDIVEDTNIDTKRIKLGNEQVLAASNENILLDKISACHEKGTGNTRMKDYDDLLRFLYSNEKFDRELLGMLAIKRKIKLELSRNYAGEETENHWTVYRKKTLKKGMDDLPETLYEAIEIINEGLRKIA